MKYAFPVTNYIYSVTAETLVIILETDFEIYFVNYFEDLCIGNDNVEVF